MDTFDEPISPYRAKKAIKKCEEGSASLKDRQICDLAKIIQVAPVALNEIPWEKMTAQVLFFGEVHLDQDIKNFLTAHLDHLEGIGVNALAMEMLNSKHQPIIDGYLKNELGIEDVKKVLEKEWNYQSDGYLRLIEAAKLRGFKILALDDRTDDLQKIPFFDQIHLRDAHMADVLAQAIAQDPKLKVAVLCGRLHAYKNYSQENLVDSLPSMLRKKFNLSTQTILAFTDWDKSAPNSLYKASYGEFTQGLTVFPEDHPYVDFILYLRSP